MNDQRLEEIRKFAAHPLEAFNRLNDIGKAYAYGSDINFLLACIDELKRKIVIWQDMNSGGRAKEWRALEARVKVLTEALERIGCRMEHGDQEPCPVCAEVDKALSPEPPEQSNPSENEGRGKA